MNANWYYIRGGQRFGPFRFEQIQLLAASGMLQLDDLVQSEGAATWVQAREVPDLRFQQAAGVANPAAINASPSTKKGQAPHRSVTRQSPDQSGAKKAVNPVVHIIQGGGGLLLGLILANTRVYEWGYIILTLSAVYFLYGLAKYTRNYR